MINIHHGGVEVRPLPGGEPRRNKISWRVPDAAGRQTWFTPATSPSSRRHHNGTDAVGYQANVGVLQPARH
ncbi:MAG: hypothetical protein ACRDRP_19230 [Pseudonocardiaceae bacterium]